jgi:hypothetical protein
MDPTRFSSLGRGFDPRIPSNLFVLLITPFAGVVAGVAALVAGDGVGSAARSGLLAGGSAFLAWAIAREIDPDDPVPAAVAAVAAPFVVLIGDPGLGVMATGLLAARILVRSTGLVPRPTDLVVVAGFAWYVATRPGGLPAALVLAAAVAADRRLPGEVSAWSIPMALVAAGGSVAAAGLTGRIAIEAVAPAGWEWLMVGVAAAGSLLILRPPLVVSMCDATGEHIVERRLRAARLGALASAAGPLLWLGGPGLVMAAGTWAAMAASFVVGMVLRPLGR